MAVVERLEDDELYLYALITDESGLDLAEFCFTDDEQPDGCWRAWPFQWTWYRDLHPQQIDQAARSVGKSLSIKIRAFAFPFVHPNAEMVVTAPEGNHLDAITDLIETQLFAVRLSREMLVAGRTGIKHRPFHVNFRNGSRIMGRIPQRDGKGVKGIHPIWLELDEAQDYPGDGWTELNETLKKGFKGAVWRAHGVTRGVQDKFYEFTQPGSRWKVHRLTAMHRPNPYWSDEVRDDAISNYGSRDNPDFRRNILGLHGDATNPLFVLPRLMKCVDTERESSFNTDEYFHARINGEMLAEGRLIVDLLDFPLSHKSRYQTFWAGMDVGYTNSPSEILVFAEYQPSATERKANEKAGLAVPDEGRSRLKMITRIHLARVSNPDQVRAIAHVIRFYRPEAFGMDSTGVGLVLYQDMQGLHEDLIDTIRPYNFSGKELVDFDANIPLEPWDDPEKEAGIHRNVKEYATDKLRGLVDDERLMLPYDRELLAQWQGATWTRTKAAMDMYGQRRFSQGDDHTLDAGRMAALANAQHAIEEMTRQRKDTRPVLDQFFAA